MHVAHCVEGSRKRKVGMEAYRHRGFLLRNIKNNFLKPEGTQGILVQGEASVDKSLRMLCRLVFKCDYVRFLERAM